MKKWRDSADHSKPVISDRVSRIPKFHDTHLAQQEDELNNKLKKWQISAEEGKRVFSTSSSSNTKNFTQIPRTSTIPSSELDKKLRKWQKSVDESKPVFSGMDQKVPKISKSWLEYKQISILKRTKSESEKENDHPKEHYWTRVLKRNIFYSFNFLKKKYIILFFSGFGNRIHGTASYSRKTIEIQKETVGSSFDGQNQSIK